jgi:hypothetical protein
LKIKGFSEIKVEKIKEAIAKCQVISRAIYLYLNSVIFELTMLSAHIAVRRQLHDRARTWPAEEKSS